MTHSQTKAYEILTNEEKTSLSLSIVHNKSTWQAGEIMGKAHYKFLEISQRAEKFLKLFTEYFDQYPRLIPTQSQIDPLFKKYIDNIISQRKTLNQTIEIINDPLYHKPKLRDSEIFREINKLKNSKFAQDNNLYHLIMDFDRWNNFRILPLELQEPSAFKRRNKQKLRKLVNLFTSLHPLAIMKIKQLYRVKRINKVNDYFYLPLITVHDKSLSEVIRVPQNIKNIREMNNMILYIFRHEHDAQRFLEIIDDYISRDFKHCTDGQRFWPEFRIISQKALNYDHIQNITPTRKYVLDNASIDRDLPLFLSYKAKTQEKLIKPRLIKNS